MALVDITNLAPDIETKLKSDFPDNYTEIIRIINEFCSTREYLNNARIIRCIIYLANKNPNKIQEYLQVAAADPRDVMLFAEYTQVKGDEPTRVRDFNNPFE